MCLEDTRNPKQIQINKDKDCQNIAKQIIDQDLEERDYLRQYPDEYYQKARGMKFDNETKTCYSPNNNKKKEKQMRMLQEQTCGFYGKDCFNCSALSLLYENGYGGCKWVDNVCVNASKLGIELEADPYFNFKSCGDPSSLCTTNLPPQVTIVTQSADYYFQININENGEIPANYACFWEFQVDSTVNYQLEFDRAWYPIQNYGYILLEEINIYMITSTKTYYLDDSLIQPETSSSIMYNVYSGTQKIKVFARNYYSITATAPNFKISIYSYEETEAKSNIFSVIALVLFILMAVFICVCMICIIRICMNRRNYNRNIQNQLERRERSERAQRDQENRLLDLISVIREKRYDKRIDKFKQYECVICLEEFQKNCLVKKIPICKHLFHSRCLDQLLKSKVVEEVYKCPLCNCEITMEKVREAKKKDREQRKQKKGNIIYPLMQQIENATNPEVIGPSTQGDNLQTEINMIQQNRQNRIAQFEQSQVNYDQQQNRQNRRGSPAQRRGNDSQLNQSRVNSQLDSSMSPLTNQGEEENRQVVQDQLVDI